MTVQQLTEKLESSGIPASFQRLRILEMLLENPGHYRADEIYESLRPEIPTLSKSTVYNSLKLFSEKGLLHALQLEEGVLHYDGILEEHAHFLCEMCKEVTNIPMPTTLLELSLPGAKVHHTDLILRGVCKNCHTENKGD